MLDNYLLGFTFVGSEYDSKSMRKINFSQGH